MVADEDSSATATCAARSVAARSVAASATNKTRIKQGWQMVADGCR